MPEVDYGHKPVLLDECIEALAIRPDTAVEVSVQTHCDHPCKAEQTAEQFPGRELFIMKNHICIRGP